MPIPKARPLPKTDDAGETETEEVPQTRRSAAAKVSWSPLTVDQSRYAIVILQGLDQTGKTHFAFTAPPPILVLTFDPANLRGVAKKFAGVKDIQVATFEIPKGLVATASLAGIARAEAARYTATFTAAVEGDFKTIIMDREDEAWELYRYEEFDGKASANPHHYVQLNMAYKGMLKLAEKHKKNLIMIDAIKEEYKNNKPTGEMKRGGFKNLGMLSQVTLESVVDNYDKFGIQVIKCRDDATKNGEVLTPQGISEVLGAEGSGNEWPVNEATREYDYFPLTFNNVMAYLIGGKSDDWT